MLQKVVRHEAWCPKKRNATGSMWGLEGRRCWQCLVVFLLQRRCPQGHPGWVTCPQQPCAIRFSRTGAVLVTMATRTGHMTRSTF